MAATRRDKRKWRCRRLLVILTPCFLVTIYATIATTVLRSPRKIFIIAQSGPGRLGNQMFQYASALAIYHRRREQNPYQDTIEFCVDPDHPFPLTKIFAGPFPSCPKATPKPRHLFEKGYGTYTQFPEMDQCQSMNGCAFTVGPYLQSFKYLQLAGAQVRSALQFHDDIHLQARQIKKDLRSRAVVLVGIHVRRADVLDVPYLKTPPIEYYEKAMEFYLHEFGGNVHFVVASDDIGWCKRQKLFENAFLLETQSSVLDLACLSLCDHMIISVGSFGFWAAWLAMGQTVYYDQAIIIDHETNRGLVTFEDYYPDEWKGMS